MVPVPEELAPKVLNFVSWKGDPHLLERAEESAEPSGTPSADSPASRSPVGRVVARLDDVCRRLVAVIVRASLDGRSLTIPEAAAGAGLSEREVIGVITETNNLIAGEGGSAFTVLVTRQKDADDAAFTWHTRRVAIAEDAAREIDEALRRHPG